MQAAEQTVRWQRLFVANAIFTRCVVCVCVCVSLSLSLSLSLSPFSPIWPDSREMVIAMWQHCTRAVMIPVISDSEIGIPLLP